MMKYLHQCLIASVGLLALCVFLSPGLSLSPECSILFAAHDPGAQNNIRALYELTEVRGMQVLWLNLREHGILLKGQADLPSYVHRRVGKQRTCLCVTGFSTNLAELEVAKACAANGARATLTILEFLPGQRLNGASIFRMRQLEWLVSSDAAVEDLERRFGVPRAKLHVTGSAALETLAGRRMSPPHIERQRVLRLLTRRHQHWRAQPPPPATPIISLFIPAPEAYVGGSANAKPAVEALMADACAAAAPHHQQQQTQQTQQLLHPALLVVRMHPRTDARLEAAIRHATAACKSAVLDDRKLVDNESLIRASLLVLSHGSTTLVESIVLGVPAVFYRRAFDDSVMEATMGSVSHQQLPRLSTATELRRFVIQLEQEAEVREKGGSPQRNYSRSQGAGSRAGWGSPLLRSVSSSSAGDAGVEGHRGAGKRQWHVLASFI